MARAVRSATLSVWSMALAVRWASTSAWSLAPRRAVDAPCRVFGIDVRVVDGARRVVGIAVRVVDGPRRVAGICDGVVGCPRRVVGIDRRVVGCPRRVKNDHSCVAAFGARGGRAGGYVFVAPRREAARHAGFAGIASVERRRGTLRWKGRCAQPSAPEDRTTDPNRASAHKNQKNMAKSYYIIKLGLDRITPAGLLFKTRNLVNKLTGNAAFPSPVPPLGDVTAAADVLQTAINDHEANPGPNEVLQRNLATDVVKGLYTDLGSYVQAASNGDIELIKSAGLGVRKSASPRGELPAPKNMEAVATAYPGRIDIRYGGVRGRSMYETQICDGDPNVEENWKVLFLTTKVRHSITGLKSDTVYHFRVRALGVLGASPMSEPAVAKAA